MTTTNEHNKKTHEAEPIAPNMGAGFSAELARAWPRRNPRLATIIAGLASNVGIGRDYKRTGSAC